MKTGMLKSAAVGLHGRTLFLFFFTAAVAAAQSTSAFDELIPELAARIASAVPAGAQVALTIVANDDEEQAAALRMRLAAQLTARGVRISDAAAQTSVSVGCGRNLRERACVARIRGDGRDQFTTVTRPLDATAPESRDAAMALELRPVLSQPTQMLDLAAVGDRILLLDVKALTLFEQKDGGWRAAQSRPLPLLRGWPRDPRGRIGVDGERVDVFVPGGTCTGRSDSLEVICTDRQQPWPIGVDNQGLEPGRNYFRRADGTTFYNAAPLGAAANDDAIELMPRCAPGRYVVAVSRNGADGQDILQLSRVADGRLVPAGSPVMLAGVLTALWPQTDKSSAVVITHDITAGRYDAFRAGISCSR